MKIRLEKWNDLDYVVFTAETLEEYVTLQALNNTLALSDWEDDDDDDVLFYEFWFEV